MGDLSYYYQRRNDIRTGDLIEFASSTVLGWTIRKFSKKDVNHTSTVIRYIVEGDNKPRRYVMEALEHGYVSNFLSQRLERFKGKVYWLPLKREYDIYRVCIANIAHEFIGIPYDFRSLLKNVAGHVSSDIKRLFCSEAADEQYRKCNLLKESFNSGKRLRPGEFMKTGLFEKRVRIF